MAKTARAGAPRRRGVTPLHTLRLARTMTQRELAALVGIRQQTLAMYESGEIIPPPDRRAHLATILGTSSDALWPPASLRRAPASAG